METPETLETSVTGKGFLDLSPELRNQIYALVLNKHHGTKAPGIINSCKQTREDALKLFYSTHCLDFFDLPSKGHRNYYESVNKLLDAVGNENASRIRGMRFHPTGAIWVDKHDGGYPKIEHAPLELEVRITRLDDGGWVAFGRWSAEGYPELEFERLSVEAAKAGSSMKGGEDPATMMWRLVAREVHMLPVPVMPFEY